MMDFNPLPAWIGWLATGVFFAAWFIYWWKFRKGKRVESGLVGPIPIDGFADCHYPKDFDDGDLALLRLVVIRDDVFRYCELEYGKTERWIVPKVTLIWDEPREDHPNVMWSRAGDRIVLKIQPEMYWHFAGEVHNLFRFGMYGPGSDKLTYDDADREAALMVRDWIVKRYKEA